MLYKLSNSIFFAVAFFINHTFELSNMATLEVYTAYINLIAFIRYKRPMVEWKYMKRLIVSKKELKAMK